MAYSTKDDLLTGDIPMPDRFGDGTKFVDMAADEIDGQIGHIFVTPIELEDLPVNRPARLLLKKINNLIASGRIITDMAAAGEDRDLHAYGRSLLLEGLDLLNRLSAGRIDIPGAAPLPGTELDSTGPTIQNEDPESLVEGFYRQVSHGEIRGPLSPLRPYAPRVLP